MGIRDSAAGAPAGASGLDVADEVAALARGLNGVLANIDPAEAERMLEAALGGPWTAGRVVVALAAVRNDDLLDNCLLSTYYSPREPERFYFACPRQPHSDPLYSSEASNVYKRQ